MFCLRRPGCPVHASSGRATAHSLEARRLFNGSVAAEASDESTLSRGEVVARYVFYNNSSYDGNDPLAGPADDGAIAPDKAALLPGQRPSFANYTSYSRGINGVMVDVAGLPAGSAGAIGADDFVFRAGNNGDPSTWGVAPAPATVGARELDEDGVTRVTITWRDGVVRNRWLQVTVKAGAGTGLASDDVFFFGNLAGETGDEAGVARVTSGEPSLARPLLFSDSGIGDPYDFDRSGRVEGADVLLVRRNVYRRLHMPAAFTGAGMGLAATYFDDPGFAGVATQRVDRTVNFDWADRSPAPDIEPNTYSARWTGQVRPEFSEQYTFHTTSNDGVRLWVDGQLLIDNWTNHAATQDTGRITLAAGRKYDLRLEYYQNTGTAVMKLEWSSPSRARQVVPAARLYPAAPESISLPSDDPANPAPPPLAGDWRMIFRDEFAEDTLDPVWRTAQYWDHDHTVVGQGELQVYDATGVSVAGGMLRLTARREEKHGMPYVSGLVQTGGRSGVSGEPRFNFQYGYMEVRAKLPAGQGLWPAIWMMPASHDDDNGELDVLEMVGSDPTTANFALHRNGLDEVEDWAGANLTRTFHTFGVDWQPTHVVWYVDGVERARVTDPALICPEAMYPILNVAVGGDWAGAPDESTPFPATMEVDYVRVWQT